MHWFGERSAVMEKNTCIKKIHEHAVNVMYLDAIKYEDKLSMSCMDTSFFVDVCHSTVALILG